MAWNLGNRESTACLASIRDPRSTPLYADSSALHVFATAEASNSLKAETTFDAKIRKIEQIFCYFIALENITNLGFRQSTRFCHPKELYSIYS